LHSSCAKPEFCERFISYPLSIVRDFCKDLLACILIRKRTAILSLRSAGQQTSESVARRHSNSRAAPSATATRSRTI
jgi:hypothetical protein